MSGFKGRTGERVFEVTVLYTVDPTDVDPEVYGTVPKEREWVNEVMREFGETRRKITVRRRKDLEKA